MVEATTWNMDSLYLHLSGQIADLRRHTEQRFGDAERVMKATLEASDKTVAGALAAQKEAAMKSEKSAETRHGELVQRLNQTADILNEKLTTLALRYEGTVASSHGMDRAWGYLAGVVGIGIAIAAVVIR